MDTTQQVSEIIVPDESLIQKIYLVRGQKVMLDRDLGVLYGYETKRMHEHKKK